jgi:hypothetical protein
VLICCVLFLRHRLRALEHPSLDKWTYAVLLNCASALNRAFLGPPGAPGGASYI